MSPPPEPADAAPLPADVATLKALLLAERASAARLAGQNEQLRAIVKELQRALFGRRSASRCSPLPGKREARCRRRRLSPRHWQCIPNDTRLPVTWPLLARPRPRP